MWSTEKSNWGINTNSVATIIADNRQMSVAIAAVEMGLVALFSYLLGTYLTKQLKVLRRFARTISEGDYTVQIPIKSGDEIGEVAKAFNRMSSALRESELERDAKDAELIEANHTLEDRVERRTAKIQTQMVELQAAYGQIEDTQAKLVQSEKLASIGQLAAGVAHELNNPIGFVRSNLSTLSEYINSYHKLIDLYQNYLRDESSRDQSSQLIAAFEKTRGH